MDLNKFGQDLRSDPIEGPDFLDLCIAILAIQIQKTRLIYASRLRQYSQEH